MITKGKFGMTGNLCSGLANRRLQPLGHVSDAADMPDAPRNSKKGKSL
jgi:hypothetical protein